MLTVGRLSLTAMPPSPELEAPVNKKPPRYPPMIPERMAVSLHSQTGLTGKPLHSLLWSPERKREMMRRPNDLETLAWQCLTRGLILSQSGMYHARDGGDIR